MPSGFMARLLLAGFVLLLLAPIGFAQDGVTWERTSGTEHPEAGGEVEHAGGQGRVRVFTDVAGVFSGSKALLEVWNHVQLELTGSGSRDCRWLQFVYRVRKDELGKEVPGVYQTDLFHPYGEAGRHVDSGHPTDPHYDAEGRSVRSDTESSLIDGPSVDPQRGIHEVRAVFDAFLICHGRVVYHVHWERVGRRGPNERWSRRYENVRGGPADGLPDWARGDKVTGGWQRTDGTTVSNPHQYDNPVLPEHRVPSGD